MTIVVSREELNTVVDALDEAVGLLNRCECGGAWEKWCRADRLDIAVKIGTRMVGKS